MVRADERQLIQEDVITCKANSQQPQIRRSEKLILWEFLLDILMQPNFEPYIRWTGNLLEFVIANPAVVFTEFQRRKCDAARPTMEHEDPSERWKGNLVGVTEVKNRLRALRLEYYANSYSNGSNKPKIEKIRTKSGYAFVSYESICNRLEMTVEQILEYAQQVGAKYQEPEYINSPKGFQTHKEENIKAKKLPAFIQTPEAKTVQSQETQVSTEPVPENKPEPVTLVISTFINVLYPQSQDPSSTTNSNISLGVYPMNIFSAQIPGDIASVSTINIINNVYPVDYTKLTNYSNLESPVAPGGFGGPENVV